MATPGFDERPRSPRLLLAACLIILVMVASACGGSGSDDTAREGGERDPEPEVVEDRCAWFSDDQIVEVLGQPYEPVEESRSTEACQLRGEDDISTLTVRSGVIDSIEDFDSRLDDPEAEVVDDLGDDARFWFDEERRHAHLVLRSEAATLHLELGGPFPYEERGDLPEGDDEDFSRETEEDGPAPPTLDEIVEDMRSRLLLLGRLALDHLPPTEFPADHEDLEHDDVSEAVSASVVCDSLDVGAIEEIVGAEADTGSLDPLGDRACSFSAGDVSLIISVLPGEASPDVLDGIGIEMEEDGETFVWVPEPIEDLGAAAVWMGDPRDPGAGELHAVLGTTYIHIQSNRLEGGAEVEEHAVSVARLIESSDLLDLVNPDVDENTDD